jgi:hypothetical protein
MNALINLYRNSQRIIGWVTDFQHVYMAMYAGTHLLVNHIMWWVKVLK